MFGGLYLLLLVGSCAPCVANLPSLGDLSGKWVDPTAPVSLEANIGPEQRDMAVINNFWGAVGVAPQTIRPVDLFGVNSLELPPFAGCGAAKGLEDGCGSLFAF